MNVNAKVLIYKTTGGGVSCKVKLGTIGFTYHHGERRHIRWNKGPDKDEYPLIVSFSYLEDFLSVNRVNYENIEIDSNSIDTFYGYSTWNGEKFFANLTPAKVEEWWNYDTPDLYRYTVNKERNSSLLGLKLICFSKRLVETGWPEIYISEDITQEEVQKLSKGHEGTRLVEEMWNTLNAKKLSEEEIKVLLEEVKRYEQKIQDCIDKHKDEILSAIKDMKDDAGVPDCGFLRIYSKNPKYNEQKRLLKYAKRYDIAGIPWMNIRLPYEPQSVTIKKIEFQKVKEIVARELGEELYCTAILD